MRNLVILSVVLCGCPENTEPTAKTGDTGTPPDTDTTTTPVGGFDVAGVVIDITTSAPIDPAGMCIALVDPSPALQGQPAVVVMGPVELGAGGSFLFSAVPVAPPIGLLLSVDDCNAEPVDCAEGVTDAAYTAATGIQGSSFAGLGKGDVVQTAAFAVTCPLLAGLEGSATGVGYPGDLGDDGFLLGFVWEGDGTNAPIGGATVTCDGCPGTWYSDGDAAGGLFAGESLNTATVPLGGSMFVIPEAPIGNYGADDGGAHSFADQLNGSNPGSAVVTVFFGGPPAP